MAIEWYLMNSNNDTVSGFESEDFNYFSQDAFNEAVNSALGIDVEICNFDLTERKNTRVIIQQNVQDTRLKTMQRTMLTPIGSCKAGQYVFYKNRYWLIIGLVDDNGFYEKSVLILCNYLLTWQSAKGNIIQRWANVTSASQYNNGETSTQFYFSRSDQLMILVPDDEECLLIPHKKRLIIDKRCSIYEKNIDTTKTVDTTNPVLVYKLTRIDNVLFSYQDSGHAEYMATQDEQHEDDGFYYIDNKGYWLCDTPTPTDNKSILLSSHIECEEPEIYCGLEPGVFISHFFDNNGKEVSLSPKWEINCSFIDKLHIEYIGNSIFISADDNNLINKSFELSLSADGYDKNTIIVTIKAFM